MDNQLLSPTGVIACDNILWDAKTFNQADSNGKALHEFVDYVKNDNRVDQVGVGIGLMYIEYLYKIIFSCYKLNIPLPNFFKTFPFINDVYYIHNAQFVFSIDNRAYTGWNFHYQAESQSDKQLLIRSILTH